MKTNGNCVMLIVNLLLIGHLVIKRAIGTKQKENRRMHNLLLNAMTNTTTDKVNPLLEPCNRVDGQRGEEEAAEDTTLAPPTRHGTLKRKNSLSAATNKSL